MGRTKQFEERIQLPLTEGTSARIDALCDDGEYRLDFIRAAIDTEIKKRTARNARAAAAQRPSDD